MATKEQLIESIHAHCKNSIYTSKQVVGKILDDLYPNHCGTPSENVVNELIEIIRVYKNTGNGLEETANKIYSIIECTDCPPDSFSNLNPKAPRCFVCLQQDSADELSKEIEQPISLSDWAKGVIEDSKDIAKFLNADINKQLVKDVANKLYHPCNQHTHINMGHPGSHSHVQNFEWPGKILETNLSEKELQDKQNQRIKLMGETSAKQCALRDLSLLTEMIKDAPYLNIQDISAIQMNLKKCRDICQNAFERENLPGKIYHWKIPSHYTDNDGKDLAITEDERIKLLQLQDQRTYEESFFKSPCPSKIEYSSKLPGHVPLPGVVESYLPKEVALPGQVLAIKTDGLEWNSLSETESKLLDREVMREKYARGEVDFVTRAVEFNRKKK